MQGDAILQSVVFWHSCPCLSPKLDFLDSNGISCCHKRPADHVCVCGWEWMIALRLMPAVRISKAFLPKRPPCTPTHGFAYIEFQLMSVH